MTDSEGRSALDRAGAWLADYLGQRDGQSAAGAVIVAGALAGHAPRTTKRAAASIGVVMARKGRGTVWTMPGEQDDDVPGIESGHEPGQVLGQAVIAEPTTPAEPEVVAPPRTWRVPGRRDIYGRVTEYHQVSSPEAASHWDERQWERID